MPTLRLANLIDGRLRAPRHDRWLDVFEPATGQVFAHCPDSSAEDVAVAVAAAQRAAPGWAATPTERRASLLNALADLVEGITPENRHSEVYWGPPVGNEFGADVDVDW